jgi:hypothetical protein
MNWESVVNIVIGWMNGGRFQVEAVHFVQMGSGAHSASDG